MGIKLNFKIDDDYLIVHTLSNMAENKFSSTKNREDVVVFQNYAWIKCEPCYNMLIGRLYAREIKRYDLYEISKRLPNFIKTLKSSRQYKKIRNQTEEYLISCKNQWNGNYPVTIKIIKEITGLTLNKKFTVYITHPSLKNGQYKGNNIIEWGHNEDWLNYTTVYLWHEILHSYLGTSDKGHAIIELITDNELRIRLNGGKYPPFVGHDKLKEIKKRLLPQWKKYLGSKRRNVLKFYRKLDL